jgi:hypothetical protein
MMEINKKTQDCESFVRQLVFLEGILANLSVTLRKLVDEHDVFGGKEEQKHKNEGGLYYADIGKFLLQAIYWKKVVADRLIEPGFNDEPNN